MRLNGQASAGWASPTCYPIGGEGGQRPPYAACGSRRAARCPCLGTFSALLCGAMLLFMMTGCQAPRMGQPLAKDLAGSAPDHQIDFWHSLADQPITSNDQAFHGLLLYADGKDDSADYAARVKELKSRKWLPADFDSPAGAGVSRGTLASAICRIANIKGGLTMHVLGPIPRYAVRELMFLNIYPASTPNQSFSGTDFIGIIGALEDYQRANMHQKVSTETMSSGVTEKDRK